MRSIALMNQKGGVGKTTTAVHLAAFLRNLDRKVLLVDIDPQANLTSWLLGRGSEALEATVSELFQGAATLDEIILPTSIPGIDIVPADLRLSGTERALAGEIGAESILKNGIESAELAPCEEDRSFDIYDYLLIDCPPSIGMLTVNALSAVNEILIPVQAHALALHGVANLRRVISVIQSRLNPRLQVTGLLLTMTDGRTNLSREVERSAREHFPDLVYKSTIRENVRVAECPSHFMSVDRYAPDSPVVADYRRLAEEVVEQEAAAGPAKNTLLEDLAPPLPEPTEFQETA